MFAGDNLKPAADASYRNLLWENYYVDHSFNIGKKIQRDKEIGTIDTWGPFFRVSFDLIIHSYSRKSLWSTLLAFRIEGDCHQQSCKIPVLFFWFSGYIRFSNTVDNIHYYLNYKIVLNQWYKIIIEQKSINRKVIKLKNYPSDFNNQGYYYTLTIDGKLISSFPLLNPKTFNDVKVLAGDDFNPAANASFKNLVWENLPVPDIFFQIDTPTMVRLENKMIIR